MRINPLHLAGVALALVGANAKNAAADTTIANATTAPLQTSTAGNVTVNTGGSITVTAGQNAITVDSDAVIANGGQLLSKDADNSAGVVIQGGSFTGTITNSGSMTLNETYALTDTDSDGNLDGAWASGTGRNAIWLQTGTWNGNIVSSGTISVQGNNSNGIRLDSVLNGALNVSGGIEVQGDGSHGVAINGGAAGGVTGDVNLTGSISVRGQDSIGLLVDAPIGGALNITATIGTTGLHSTTRPTAVAVISALDNPDDFQQSGATVQIQSSVANGVTFGGIGVEDDNDDDHDAVLESAGDTDDDKGASIVSLGSAPALLITNNATTPVDVVLGATTPTYTLGYGLVNRGSITASSVYDTFSATAVRIAGQGGAHVTSTLGFLNDGKISASGFNNDTTGIDIGADATVSDILNRGTVSVQGVSDAPDAAVGLLIDPLGHVDSFTNRGTFAVAMTGPLGSATGISDASSTLTTITNSGSLSAVVAPADSASTASGQAIAIDLHASSANVTLTQEADAVFDDDDLVDDDASTRPAVQIIGDVLLGSGADIVNLNAGKMIGDMDLGGGADNLFIRNGATFTGVLSDSGNDLTIDVVNGALNLTGGAVTVSSAHFETDGVLGVTLSGNNADPPVITSNGAVTFDAGSKINITLPTGLPLSGVQTFLTAPVGQLSYAGVLNTATAPFIYNVAIDSPVGDPDSLEAVYSLKSAAQLGLDPNATSAFDATITALRTDATASTALTSLTSNEQVESAFASLMPNYSGAAAELAATAIQQSISATSNRLLAARIRDQKDTSIWAQEIGYNVNRNSDSFGIDYRGWGFGFAGGIDAPLNNGALFGLSASFVASEVTQPQRDDGQLSTSIGEANAYLGTSLGPFDLDIVAGAGIGKLKSQRQVQIGTTFTALADADWWAYEGHGSARISMPLSVTNWLVVTPRVALTYVAMNEQSYEESGGGTAVDLSVDSTTSQRLWADALVDFSMRFGHIGESVIAPHLSLGYRSSVIDDAADRTLHFLSGGPNFTLTDTTTGTGGPLIGLGIEASNGFSTFAINYEGEFGDELDRHSLNASVRFRF